MTAMYEDGRRAWPRVALDRATFERWVDERTPAGGDPSALRGAELYLACACAHGDEQAMAEFERHYLCEVPAFMAPSKASAQLVDDVQQQLRERLFVDGKIARFSGRGSMASWLRVVTLRAATDLRRAGRSDLELDEAMPAATLDPELEVIKARYGDAFRSALRDALSELDPEDRGVLRLFYIDGLNIERIGALMRVSRATIGRRMIALRERVLRGTRGLLQARLHVTPNELESLLRCVRSDLAMSLSVLLRDP
jgi:RNA polymerase sigma-70 factor (ECF subfamily)